MSTKTTRTIRSDEDGFCRMPLVHLAKLRKEKAIPPSAFNLLMELYFLFAENGFPNEMPITGDELAERIGTSRQFAKKCAGVLTDRGIIRCSSRSSVGTAAYGFCEGWKPSVVASEIAPKVAKPVAQPKKVSSSPLSSPLSSSPRTLSPYPPIIPPTTIQENFCAELGFCAKPSHEDSTQNVEPAFIEMPLIDGTLYAVTQTDVKRYKELFPAVDIEQELRSMTAWLENNPKNRKTRGGIKRYISNWLIRKQNRSQTQKPKQPAWEPKYYFAEFDND